MAAKQNSESRLGFLFANKLRTIFNSLFALFLWPLGCFYFSSLGNLKQQATGRKAERVTAKISDLLFTVGNKKMSGRKKTWNYYYDYTYTTTENKCGKKLPVKEESSLKVFVKIHQLRSSSVKNFTDCTGWS